MWSNSNSALSPNSSTTKSSFSPLSKKRSLRLEVFLGVLGLCLIIVGGVAAFYLSQQEQNITPSACNWECNSCGCGCSDYFDSRPECRNPGGGGGAAPAPAPNCPSGWSCNGNCADQNAVNIFNGTWQDGRARWLWEAAGNTAACGGNPSSLKSGTGGGAEGGTGGGSNKCDTSAITAIACRDKDVGFNAGPCVCQRGQGTSCGCVVPSNTTNLPNGQPCSTNSNCNSNNCSSNVCAAAPAPAAGGTGGTSQVCCLNLSNGVRSTATGSCSTNQQQVHTGACTTADQNQSQICCLNTSTNQYTTQVGTCTSGSQVVHSGSCTAQETGTACASGWFCKGNCASAAVVALFNATWENGRSQWLWEDAGNNNSCGGSPSTPRVAGPNPGVTVVCSQWNNSPQGCGGHNEVCSYNSSTGACTNKAVTVNCSQWNNSPQGCGGHADACYYTSTGSTTGICAQRVGGVSTGAPTVTGVSTVCLVNGNYVADGTTYCSPSRDRVLRCSNGAQATFKTCASGTTCQTQGTSTDCVAPAPANATKRSGESCTTNSECVAGLGCLPSTGGNRTCQVLTTQCYDLTQDSNSRWRCTLRSVAGTTCPGGLYGLSALSECQTAASTRNIVYSPTGGQAVVGPTELGPSGNVSASCTAFHRQSLVTQALKRTSCLTRGGFNSTTCDCNQATVQCYALTQDSSSRWQCTTTTAPGSICPGGMYSLSSLSACQSDAATRNAVYNVAPTGGSQTGSNQGTGVDTTQLQLNACNASCEQSIPRGVTNYAQALAACRQSCTGITNGGEGSVVPPQPLVCETFQVTECAEKNQPLCTRTGQRLSDFTCATDPNNRPYCSTITRLGCALNGGCLETPNGGTCRGQQLPCFRITGDGSGRGFRCEQIGNVGAMECNTRPMHFNDQGSCQSRAAEMTAQEANTVVDTPRFELPTTPVVPAVPSTPATCPTISTLRGMACGSRGFNTVTCACNPEPPTPAPSCNFAVRWYRETIACRMRGGFVASTCDCRFPADPQLNIPTPQENLNQQNLNNLLESNQVQCETLNTTACGFNSPKCEVVDGRCQTAAN